VGLTIRQFCIRSSHESIAFYEIGVCFFMSVCSCSPELRDTERARLPIDWS
jgi:hypothetical protein